MAPYKKDTPDTEEDVLVEDRFSYPNSLPKEQQESVWVTSTLWTVIIVFTICTLILVIGGSIFFLR